MLLCYTSEESLEVKLPTYGQMEKQRWEESEKKREERSEKRKGQKKEDAGARKGSKDAVHFVFPMICGSGGRKVGSQKLRVGSHLGRWEMKNCTPLWREAHFEVKMHKTHQARSIFGSWDVEKVHAVVARSTCGSEMYKKTDGLGPLMEVRMWFCVACARDSAPCKKWAKRARAGFVAVARMLAGVGHLKMICKDAFRVAGTIRDMFTRDVRRSGRRFPEKSCIWSVWSSGLLRWFCVTGAALRITWPHFFVASASL